MRSNCGVQTNQDWPQPVPRAYIRHPADVPIEIENADLPEEAFSRLRDVSLGGLSCRASEAVALDTLVRVTIPCAEPPFVIRGRVAWCEQQGAAFDVGIQFLADDDAFAARMVEQVCHIEHYRHQVLRTEGRTIDSETAAREWIAKFAQDFPNPS